MLFVPPLFLSELDAQCGLWSRQELEQMNDRFVAAVSNAIRSGRESAAAVSATVRINSSLNGSRRRAEEAAIEAGWMELCRRKGDMAFLEVVQFVRERTLINLEVIRRGLAQRLRERREELWAGPVIGSSNVKGEKPVITVVSRFARLGLLRTNLAGDEGGSARSRPMRNAAS